MKPDLLSNDKVIITAAITGGILGKESNPNIPTTPEEQAQAALDCYNAGALFALTTVAAGLTGPSLPRENQGRSSGWSGGSDNEIR